MTPEKFMSRLMSNLDGSQDAKIAALIKAMEKIEYASRKDSLTEHERLQSVRTVVCATLSRYGSDVGKSVGQKS